MRLAALALPVALALACCENHPTRGDASTPSASTARADNEVHMSFFDAIRTRHSTRAFTSDDVSEADLRWILGAANRAPSAGNLQAYEIVVVRNAETRKRLAAAAHGQSHVASAPVVLVFLAHPARNAERYGERGARLYALQDATIAATYAELAAQVLGLGSSWVGAVDDDAVLSLVSAPEGLVFSSLLVIGHAAEPGNVTPRRTLDDLRHDERFRVR